MDKATKDELIGRAIIMVVGVVSRFVFDLVTKAFRKKKKSVDEEIE